MAQKAVRSPPVGASTLAMDANDNAGYLKVRVVRTFLRACSLLQWNALGMSCLSRSLFRQPGMALPHEKVFAD